MSKVMSIRLSDDVYERLVSSSQKMGLTKGGYITFALKNRFEAEDTFAQMPDVLSKIDLISKQLEELNK